MKEKGMQAQVPNLAAAVLEGWNRVQGSHFLRPCGLADIADAILYIGW